METVRVDVKQVAIAFVVMSDQPDYTLDVGVVHGLSKEMYASGNLFQHASDLLDSGHIREIAVVGGDGRRTGGSIPKEAWIGSDAVKDSLVEIGFIPEAILTTADITNSKEEALAIIKMCKDHDWMTAGSITVAYHGGRMLPYMVAAMRELHYWIDYRMLPPRKTDWWMEILGSQGLSMTNCVDSAMADAVKIESHIEKGFAASFDDVLHYLRHRQKIVANQAWV